MNTTYGMADIAMAAFSLFFMQSPSFLAHQRHLENGHGRSNCQTLFGMRKIPSDNHIRDMLDPVDRRCSIRYSLIVVELDQAAAWTPSAAWATTC